MLIKKPKDDDRFLWTKHVFEKMKFYRLSGQRVKRVLINPKRREEGVAPNTIAAGELTGSKKHPYEIWVMYQIIKSNIKNQISKINKKFILSEVEGYNPKILKQQNLKTLNSGARIRIISAWRYPGISPKGKPIHIPEDALRDLDVY